MSRAAAPLSRTAAVAAMPRRPAAGRTVAEVADAAWKTTTKTAVRAAVSSAAAATVKRAALMMVAGPRKMPQ